MENNLHWWKKFSTNNSDKKINELIVAIDEVEQNLDKDKIIDIKNSINNLDSDKYENEISILNKKCNILENRADRQISDDFGSFLRTLRKERRLSLAQLGEKTGISPSYINRLELRQRKSPSINIMENLANALDVPLSILANAAGINLNDGKPIYIQDLIHQNNISLSRYENELDDSSKTKLLDLIVFIIKEDLDLNKTSNSETLLQLANDFRNEIK